jgi:hypothetical protein
MDESGDLGFDFQKSRTTKNFLITCLFTKNKRPLEKCVKKAHSGLRKKIDAKEAYYTHIMKNQLHV